MTPQFVNAGKIRLLNSSEPAEVHFENLHRQYADALHRLRSHVDDAIDTGEFVRASENVSLLFFRYMMRELLPLLSIISSDDDHLCTKCATAAYKLNELALHKYDC